MHVTLNMTTSLNGVAARENDSTDIFQRGEWVMFMEMARKSGALIWGRRVHEVVRGYGVQALAAFAAGAERESDRTAFRSARLRCDDPRVRPSHAPRCQRSSCRRLVPAPRYGARDLGSGPHLLRSAVPHDGNDSTITASVTTAVVPRAR
jgi:hypothetical protein